jgi:fucose 4-O-acetylase-like acetyltransferase
MKQESKRLIYIDAAKGIGIIGVVFSHVYKGLLAAGMMPDSCIWNIIHDMTIPFRMPLFFLISGLFLRQELYSTWLPTIGRRAEELLLPFLIWYSLQGSIELAVSSYTNAQASLSEILIGYIIPRGQFWFLPALFIAFAFTYTCSRFKHWRIWALPVSLIFLMMPDLGKAVLFIPFFLIGSIITKKNVLILANKWIVLASVCVYLALWPFYSSIKNFNTVDGYLIRAVLILLIGLAGIVITIGISKILPKSIQAVFAFIGGISMPIYVAHVMATSGSRIVLKHVFHCESLNIYVTAGIASGILFPIFVYYLAKWMGADWIFGRLSFATLTRLFGKKPTQT